LNNLIVLFLSIIFLSQVSTAAFAQSFDNYYEKKRENKLPKQIISNSTFKKNDNILKPNHHLIRNAFSSTSNPKNKKSKKYSKVACTDQQVYRQIDGSCNNLSEDISINWGSKDIALKRFIPDVYNDNNDLVGQNRKHSRVISNTIFKTENDIPSNSLSSFVFTWGQFLDHDIILTPTDSVTANISVVPNDIIISPIPFMRSAILQGTGSNGISREQINNTTAWIDASQVYGSNIELANELRTFENGKLKTATADNGETILPQINGQFLAGDERALEQPGLTSLHILFVREHNRICNALLACGITNDEEIYQLARKKVGALLQSITYNEFLPALGIQLPEYIGYDNTIQPDILNVFGTAAFRLGHTMVTDELLFYNDEGQQLESLSLAEAFFKPTITQQNGIEIILNGLAQQFQQKVDAKVVESLRSFLFGAPPNAGFDLVALNIQRGRDHGLDDYNDYRSAFGIRLATNFSDITSDTILQNNLTNIYNNDVNDIDVWVGLLSEDHLPNAAVGETLHAMLSTQFTALRNGDFYYYKNDPALSDNEKRSIDNTRLSDIIKRNTNIKNIKYNVFYGPCDEEKISLNCTTDDNICNCAPSEICNQGNCEPIIDSETCMCSIKVEMKNETACATVIYDIQEDIRKYETTIEPNSNFTLNSFKNKVYSAHLVNESYKKQYYFIRECNQQTININFENCVEEEEICPENSVEENEINTIYRMNVFNEIITTNTFFSNARVEYKAGKKIILKPGFKAIEGSYFNASIDQICEEYDDGQSSDNKLKGNKTALLLFQIYPNPANDFFTLKYQLTKKTTLNIALYNSVGKKLDMITKANQKVGKYELPYNIKRFPVGIYYITISTKNNVETKKLIIHR